MNKYLKGLRWLLGVGMDGDQLADTATTDEQIDFLKSYECCLIDEEGNELDWEAFDDPTEPECLLRVLRKDRKLYAAGVITGNIPALCVATIDDCRCIRFEFRQILSGGTSVLEADLRCPELQGRKMVDNLVLASEMAEDQSIAEELGLE